MVISGWRPRITGILHWWVSFSLFSSAIGLDGGDQVATVFTFFLVPITLADPRKNHWKKLKVTDGKYINNRMIILVTWYIIRIQVAVLYGHSVIAKLAEEEWINGTAVWYYLQNPMLSVPSIIEGPVMSLLSTPFIILPTWGSLIIQVILVIALFAPKRYWTTILILAALMHEIFAVFLGLISFSLAMLGILILYLRPLDKSIKLKHFRLTRIRSTIKYWYQKRVSRKAEE